MARERGEVLFSAELRVGESISTDRSMLAQVGVWSAFLATAGIILFDLTAGLGAAGIGVGAWPVGSALAIAPLLCRPHCRAGP